MEGFVKIPLLVVDSTIISITAKTMKKSIVTKGVFVTITTLIEPTQPVVVYNTTSAHL